MASTAKQKFDAAVNVIQSLPKNGSFQPSHDLQLRFYGYYKQATLGKCTQPKPSFWDVVKKAKWEAWHRLGNMPKEDAMLKYVDELKTIVETMPQTEVVGDFMETVGCFYELVDEKALAATFKDKAKADQEQDGNKSDEGVIDQSDNNSEDESVNKSEAQSSQVYETASSNAATGNEDGPLVTGETGNDEGRESSDSGHQEPEEQPPEETELHTDVNNVDTTGTFVIKLDTEALTGKIMAVDTSPKMPNGVRSEDEGSDSDEEFCDTTEPDEQQVPALVSLSNASSSTPIKTSPMVDNVYRAVTSQEQASKWTMSPIKYGDTNQNLDVNQTRRRDFIQSSNTPTTDRIDGALNRQNAEQYNPSNGLPLDGGHGSFGFDVEQPSGVQTRGGGETPGGGYRGYEGQASDRNRAGRGQGLTEQGSNQARVGPSRVSSGGGGQRGHGRDIVHEDASSQQIGVALARLQQDMNNIISRLETLETLACLQRQVKEQEETLADKRRRERENAWWPFQNLSTRTVVALVVWPFIAQWIIKMLTRNRSRPGRR